MEREIREVKRALEHCHVCCKHAMEESDFKGVKFITGQISGLEMALEILEGGSALIDTEIEDIVNNL